MNSDDEGIRWNEIQWESLDHLKIELLNYFAAILTPVKKGPDEEEVKLLGSGTFIKTDEFYGILTAEHVTHEVKPLDEIGVMLENIPERVEHFTIDNRDLEIIDVFKGSNKPEGPDLAVIQLLPSEKLSTIRAKKSFYDISINREGILESPRELDRGIWILCGIPDELTVTRNGERGFKYFKGYRGCCIVSNDIKEEFLNYYDLLKIGIRHNLNKDMPQSFGGFSGGGLWQVPLLKDMTTKKPILSGVAFYQVGPKDQRSDIVCHGRHSIYRSVYEAIKERR